MHGTRRIPRLPVLALAAAAAVSYIGLVATPASAATAAAGGNTLVIDAGTTVRPVTYVGAGGLYALADATTPPASVLYPLHLQQLVQPAPGVQQLGNGATVPTGDALKVAGSMISVGAQETVRMPDIYPDFPYKWVSWDDWLSKVDTMVQARLAANTTTNINGWEPWNEPNWTWDTAKAGPFLDGWTRTVQEIKKYDTVTPIVGPSYSLWDVNLMRAFLQNAIATNTVPDVISWHELSGYGIVEGDVAAYRALEKQLGIGPLPIEIEEYAEPNEVDSPSDALHYLAAFERSGIRDAERAYWFESGTVDGLLYDNQPTGTYWLYKWYGDMTGNILATTPNGNEDGVAALDSTRKVLDAVVGGGTGKNTVTVDNLTSFGDNVQVNLQYTPTSGRYHNVSAPTNLWTRTLPVTNGTVTIPIGAQDPGGAYNIVVTPASGPTTTYQQTYEAENATVVNAARLSSADASNGGYVGRLDNSGDVRNDSFIDFLVDEPVTGDYDFSIRYANGTGADSTQGLAYDGSAFQTVTYPATPGWGQFATVAGPTLHLQQGYNVIRLAKGAPNFAGGTGYAELDSITLKSQTTVPAPTPLPDAPIATFVTRVEAETSTISDGQPLTSANASGGGYVGTLNNPDSYVDFPVTVPAAGSYKLTVGYANGGNNNGFTQNGTSDTVIALSANGGAATNVTFPVSGQWGGLGGYFPTMTTTVDLKAGANTVRLTHLDNQNYAELDYIQVSSPAGAVVDGRTTQTITFPAPGPVTVGTADVPMQAASTSGLPISYAATGAACSVVDGAVHAVSPGTCTITASQTGDADYDPAQDVVQTVVVQAAPTVIPTLTGASAPVNGWYDGTVTVALSGSTSGQIIQYQIDGGVWKSYSKAFSLSTNGMHTVNDRLIKNNLVVDGSNGSFQVKIDKTAPVTTVTRSPTASGTPRNPISVSFTATDPTSGPATISYQVNNSGWTTIPAGQRVTFTTVGNYVIGYKAVDNAGNTSAVRTTTVAITADPTTKITSSSKTATKGGYITLTVAGYHRYTPVTLTLGTVNPGTVTTDVNGTGKVTVQIPATTATGTYTVTAAEPAGALTSSITLTTS